MRENSQKIFVTQFRVLLPKSEQIFNNPSVWYSNNILPM